MREGAEWETKDKGSTARLVMIGSLLFAATTAA
ncbi:hypothetical protein MP11Mi_34190 [Gordonia sp. MP11Mi]|uniref:Uncharacterized protein n=1 Tax=Gordonia sp. MP11Mi TaxID=3022769 RepID=A0AA97D063_9ACTN